MDDLEDAAIAPEDEVARICADLIRIDSINYGDGSGPGEREAAEYVMAQLTEVGLDPVLVESEPGRASGRRPHRGSDTARPGAAPCTDTSTSSRRTPPTGRWTRSPARSATAASGGAGAVDMKDMDAMILANVRHLARTGERAAA